MKSAFALLISSLFFNFNYAHVELIKPPPRKSQYNKAYGGAPDYDMNSPLGPFPCKGYGKGPSVQTVSAGSAVDVQLLGEASHNGGHCQFSLSYDNGATFVVIKTVMSECLRGAGYDYSVQIPSEAPNGEAIFAWSWINRTGNREFYMNCADITITNSNSNSLTGPKMLVANLPGYPTIPEFTNGGYDGSDLFKNCPAVTVHGNGSGSGSASGNGSSGLMKPPKNNLIQAPSSSSNDISPSSQEVNTNSPSTSIPKYQEATSSTTPPSSTYIQENKYAQYSVPTYSAVPQTNPPTGQYPTSSRCSSSHNANPSGNGYGTNPISPPVYN